jgi:hypothetical protein
LYVDLASRLLVALGELSLVVVVVVVVESSSPAPAADDDDAADAAAAAAAAIADEDCDECDDDVSFRDGMLRHELSNLLPVSMQ